MTQLIEISSQIMLGTWLLELGTHRLTKGIGVIYTIESRSTLVWNQEPTDFQAIFITIAKGMIKEETEKSRI